MGNNNLKLRDGGEKVTDVLYSVFGCFGRKRKIDELVKLAIRNEDMLFRKVAGGKLLTKKQLDEFYQKRDSLIDEFEENVIEAEIYDFGHSTPSEYDASSDYLYTTVSRSPDYTPDPEQYDDALQQKHYQEWCKILQTKESDLELISEIEFEQYTFVTSDQREIEFTSTQVLANVQESLVDKSQTTFGERTNRTLTPAYKDHITHETTGLDVGLKLESTECGAVSKTSTKLPRRKVMGKITEGLRNRKQDSLRTKRAMSNFNSARSVKKVNVDL